MTTGESTDRFPGDRVPRMAPGIHKITGFLNVFDILSCFLDDRWMYVRD